MVKNINTQEYWNRIWRNDGLVTFREYIETFDAVKKEVGKGNRILELGSGVGFLANELKEQGNEVFCIDISDFAIQKVKRLYNIEGIACRVPPIPQPDNSYDLIVATEFLEHFHKPENVLKECVRVAPPKGIFSVPNGILGPEEWKEHYQCFTAFKFEELLKQFYKKVRVFVSSNTNENKTLIGVGSND